MSLLIIQIGNEHGAIEPFFNRQENLATALPPKKENFFYKHKIHEIYLENSLRLLCYKVNEEIVILFNGGIKTGRTYQESPELSLHFYEAQGYVKKISQAIQDGFININNRQLEDYTGSTEIEL